MKGSRAWLNALCSAVLLAGAAGAARAGPKTPGGNPTEAVELARKAVRRSGAHPDVAAGWIHRLRAAAWLPELRTGVAKETGTREAIDPTDLTRYGTYALDRLRVDVRASWRLDRLVFDPEELRANREAVRLSELRQDVALLVIRLYYERRRLQIEAGSDLGSGSRESVLRAARIEEIGAVLEALCGEP